MITVCALCLRASCWQGVVQCPTSLEIKTGTVEMTREQLLALDREHPSYWGEEAEPPPVNRAELVVAKQATTSGAGRQAAGLRARLSEIYTRWAQPAERRRRASPLVDELMGLLAEFQPPSSGPEPDLPDGVRKLDGCTVCLTDKSTIVVLGAPAALGDPEDVNHPHMCGAMGCGSGGPHVLARGPVAGDAWPDSCVQTLLGLLDELLCRLWASDETGDEHDYHHEATALVQSVLCQTADWAHVEARLAELRSKKAS